MTTPPFNARVWSIAKPGAPTMKSAIPSESAVAPATAKIERPETDAPKNGDVADPGA